MDCDSRPSPDSGAVRRSHPSARRAAARAVLPPAAHRGMEARSARLTAASPLPGAPPLTARIPSEIRPESGLRFGMRPLPRRRVNMARGWTRAVPLVLAGLLCFAMAATAAAGTRQHKAGSVDVAFIYPKTGGLAAFGGEEFDGFQAGLDYTKGKCGGYTINPTYIDDATDPATAIAAFKNEVGQGVKIIAGTGSSGIALQLGPLAAQNNVLYISGAAAADAITGLNKNTFRAGRQTLQDVIGPLVQGVTLLSHYVYQAPRNAVNTYLVRWMAKNRHSVPDLFTPDGFVTAQMICHALAKGGTDTAKQIGALEGWQFLAPKGPQRIRPADHAMLQPMFQVQLVPGKSGHFVVKVLKTVSPGNVQPPVTPFK